jgi:hypothetical protein
MDLLLADSWKLIAKVEPGQAASASPPPGGQRCRWCRRDIQVTLADSVRWLLEGAREIIGSV